MTNRVRRGNRPERMVFAPALLVRARWARSSSWSASSSPRETGSATIVSALSDAAPSLAWPPAPRPLGLESRQGGQSQLHDVASRRPVDRRHEADAAGGMLPVQGRFTW